MNNDNNISFQEFFNKMVNGIQGQDNKIFDPNLIKSKKITAELKRIVAKYNLNLSKIFKNFDKSGDGKLDYDEFTKLC